MNSYVVETIFGHQDLPRWPFYTVQWYGYEPMKTRLKVLLTSFTVLGRHTDRDFKNRTQVYKKKKKPNGKRDPSRKAMATKVSTSRNFNRTTFRGFSRLRRLSIS